MLSRQVQQTEDGLQAGCTTEFVSLGRCFAPASSLTDCSSNSFSKAKMPAHGLEEAAQACKPVAPRHFGISVRPDGQGVQGLRSVPRRNIPSSQCSESQGRLSVAWILLVVLQPRRESIGKDPRLPRTGETLAGSSVRARGRRRGHFLPVDAVGEGNRRFPSSLSHSSNCSLCALRRAPRSDPFFLLLRASCP